MPIPEKTSAVVLATTITQTRGCLGTTHTGRLSGAPAPSRRHSHGAFTPIYKRRLLRLCERFLPAGVFHRSLTLPDPKTASCAYLMRHSLQNK